MIRFGAMLLRGISVAIIGAILAGCTAAPPPALPPVPPPAGGAGTVRAIAWSSDAELLQIAGGGEECRLERWDVREARRLSADELPFCPSFLRRARDGRFVAGDGHRGIVLEGGAIRLTEGSILDASAEGDELRLDDGALVRIGAGGARLPFPGRVRDARLLPGGSAMVLSSGPEGDSLVHWAPSGEGLVRAGPFRGIDSFDVSPDGLEMVFSALREESFDVGIASTDGGEPRWIGPDPLEERMVSWAPRGNKVTYRIEGVAGAVLRTVHVPTGFQLGVALPQSSVGALAWEPRAERFAVAVSSASSAGRVDVLRYGGEERRTVIPPSAVLDAEADHLPGVAGAVLFHPARLRYGERVPVVVWVTGETAFEWSAPRAEVHQNRNVATVVVSAKQAAAGALWDAIAELAWADPSAIFAVVPPAAAGAAAGIPGRAGITVLTTRDAAGGGGSDVVRSSTDDLESFAARWLESHLKETRPEHDRS
ncbi:MAG TPA: hypothetical protein VMS56_09310 [Thermoanaerobaculia bacterium]|nr:hypothetical protein [Thermoanaerobaculia bacterium]